MPPGEAGVTREPLQDPAERKGVTHLTNPAAAAAPRYATMPHRTPTTLQIPVLRNLGKARSKLLCIDQIRGCGTEAQSCDSATSRHGSFRQQRGRRSPPAPRCPSGTKRRLGRPSLSRFLNRDPSFLVKSVACVHPNSQECSPDRKKNALHRKPASEVTRTAAEMKPKPPLLAVSDADWAEGVQRESVLRSLFTQPRVGLPAVSAAASTLGLSVNKRRTGTPPESGCNALTLQREVIDRWGPGRRRPGPHLHDVFCI